MAFMRSFSFVSAVFAMAGFAEAARAQEDPFMHLEQAALEDVWVRRDADFSQFSAMFVPPIDIAYKDVDPQVTLDGETIAAVNATFREELVAAFAGPGGYTLASNAGPGVLSIRIALRDVVVPKETWAQDAGSVAILSEGSEMTLALVLRDGGSGANLATATDRMSEDDVSTGVSTTASREAAARTAISGWSRRLRQSIEAADTRH